jgi:sensor domain CHASE-containing protein
MAASAGFRNLGQFVAAVNVSNNLGISFTELKTRMVTDGMSLGQAIQSVRPLTASPTIEAQRAEYDARGMIVDSDQAQAAATASAAQVSTSTSTGGLKTKAKPKNPAQ